MARVVVIGGGLGGLATAARLARGRHDVTLVEQASELGGSLRGIEIGAGVDVPHSPSTFTMPAVLRDLFRTTGKPIEEVLELEPVEPARRYVFADGASLDLPSGGRTATMRAFDDALGSGAGADWDALLARGRGMWDALWRDVVAAPISGGRELAGAVASRRSLAALAPWRSLDQLARATLRDPRARQVLDSYAQSVGADIRRAPAALAVLPYLEHAFGVWRVAGGAARLIDAVADRAALRGAVIRPRARVVEIKVTGGHVSAVALLGGEELAADAVVAAFDVRAAQRLVPTGPGPWRLPRAPTAGGAPFTAVMGTAQSAEPSGPPGVETVFPAPSGSVRGPGPPTPDRAPTITVCRYAYGSTPRWTVTALVPPHGSTGKDWRGNGAATAYARALLEVLAARGLDLRRSSILATRSPADLEDLTGAPGGAVLGPPPHGFGAAFGRAANRSQVRGLYAAGASAHPGAGVPFVGLSAALVSDLIGAAPRSGGGLST